MIQKRSATSDHWEVSDSSPWYIVSVVNTQLRTLMRVKESGRKVVLLHGRVCNSWFMSSALATCRHLSSPHCAMFSTVPGHTQGHSPYPGKAHSLGPSEHGVVIMTMVSLVGLGGWGLTASLASKWMPQGEPEPDHGQQGWTRQAGCCPLKVLADSKGTG